MVIGFFHPYPLQRLQRYVHLPFWQLGPHILILSYQKYRSRATDLFHIRREFANVKENKQIRNNCLAQSQPKKNQVGRPKGAVSARTRAIRAVANKAIEEGITPIEVMLDNMRFYHEKAAVLQTAVLAKVSKMSLKSDEAMELLEEFKELGTARLKAQACAVDAGPYIHPRLSATSADVKVTHSIEEAQEAFRTIEGALNSVVYGEVIEPEPVKKKEKA